MIVLAHMKESLDYYKLLDVAEAEGDLSKAISSGNIEKAKKYSKEARRSSGRSFRGSVKAGVKKATIAHG